MEIHSDIQQQFYFRVYRNTETIRPVDWEVERVDRPYTVFWFVLSGEKTIEVNDIQYDVKKGDLVIFPSQKPFKVLRNTQFNNLHHLDIAIEHRQGPYNFFSLHHFPVVLSSNEENSTSFGKLINLWKKMNTHWISLNNRSEDYNEKMNLQHSIDVIKFNKLTMEWYSELLELLLPVSHDVSFTYDPRLQILFTFIRDNISKNLSLKSLAKEVFLSESHLSLLFRSHLGLSPMGYVRQVRLQKARELLLTTKLQIREISEQVGFEGQSQLSRAFKKNVGVSPAKYRSQSHVI
ncbi:MAG TPA: AraC family transcriptional regulator [Metabacillus sp.]|nr:AraC family transcriptional regulator [Metabacillus sp.]